MLMTTAAGAAAAGLFRAWGKWGASFDPRRPNSFDLLRFVAATLVLIDHSSVLTGRLGHAGPFGYETQGGFAVAVFFIISGFLVAGSWERAPRLLAFATKRTLRIVPAYAVVVALAAVVLGPMVTDFSPGDYLRNPVTWSYFRNITFVEIHYSLPGVFVHNPFPHTVNGSIWTLPIEVLMYIVLAALGCVGLISRKVGAVLVVALAIGWFGWGPELLAAPPLFIVDLPATYTVHLALWFFLGSACWAWRDRIRYRSDVAVALLALLWSTEGTVAGMFLLHGSLPYLVIWAAQLPIRWLNHFGQRGDFSYGMYLYAFPVQQTLTLFGGAAWPHAMYIVTCFGVTLVCAIASWHWVENPALQFKAWRGVRAWSEPSQADSSPPKATGPGGL